MNRPANDGAAPLPVWIGPGWASADPAIARGHLALERIAAVLEAEAFTDLDDALAGWAAERGALVAAHALVAEGLAGGPEAVALLATSDLAGLPPGPALAAALARLHGALAVLDQ